MYKIFLPNFKTVTCRPQCCASEALQPGYSGQQLAEGARPPFACVGEPAEPVGAGQSTL